MAGREIEGLLKEGIQAARAGHKEQARELLLQVVARDEEVESAWLWLSGVVDDPQERQICLENVLALNPDNEAARAGLQWLASQPSSQVPDPAPAPPSTAPSPLPVAPPPPEASTRPVLTPVSAEDPPPPPQPPEIDPYGCPYCAGAISAEEPRCVDCGRSVIRRHRKRSGGAGLGWPALGFLILGGISWLEGMLVAEMVRLGQVSCCPNLTLLQLLIGSALFSPEGVTPELADFGNLVVLIDYGLAFLCLAVLIGLLLRSQVVYFGSLFLAGLMVVATGTGLLVGLTGWLPALLRLGVIAVVVKWLIDAAPAFEWDVRHYNADLDPDLRTDLDYYSQGQRYREMDMWAKAAAHWKVASRLAPAKAEYRAALANAYLKMGYPAAALAEADRALAQAPADGELRAFRDSLAQLEGRA